MKNIALLLYFILLVAPSITQACSCLYILNFCENTDYETNVVEVEAIQKYSGTEMGHFMDLKIVEVIQGDVTEEMITLVNYGTSCDISLDGFEIGDKFVTKYKNLQDPADGANFSMIRFFSCSSSFLRLEGNEIQGNIESEVSSQNYELFKANIGHCSDITFFDRNTEELEKYIVLFPNPTSGLVNVNASIPSPANVTLTLFNAKGQLIIAAENVSINSYDLDLSGLPRGIYFLKIRFREKTIFKRILKR